MSTTLAFLGEFGEAIDYILHSRESQAGGAEVGGSELLPLLWTHLEVSGAAMAIAIAVALPAGLALGHSGRGAFLTISVSNVGRAVPSIALIAFFVAFFPSTPEFWNVTVALALLAIPPILTNAYVGVRQVSRDAVDAARGMGMSGGQIVRRVELPLALPEIMAGLRIAMTTTVGLASLAFLAGAGGLGEALFADIAFRSNVVVAGGLAILLAVVLDLLILALQKTITPWLRAA